MSVLIKNKINLKKNENEKITGFHLAKVVILPAFIFIYLFFFTFHLSSFIYFESNEQV